MAAFSPEVCVVDFNHARGPEIEFWVTEAGQKLYDQNDWSLLPFMALSDGVHALVEDFSYFTLLRQPDSEHGPTEHEKAVTPKEGEPAPPRKGASTLFGIACTRQIRSDRLRVRSKSVTRSSVQKSVVVVVDSVAGLGELRTRLGMVTEMWFAQEDFSDTMLLKDFQESLARASIQGGPGEQFSGLSLREVIHEFRHQTLVLVKCLLLQRKMLFFSTKCERMCMLQFALLSLLPGLTNHLETASHPELEDIPDPDPAAKQTPRQELLSSFGQPLRIFSKGAFFSPYTPLQHLDMLGSYSTRSYVVGSTNALLLQQKSRYADVMVDLDTEPYSISIFSPSLKQASALSAADRRWIDNLTQQVLDTWDPDNPARPKNMGYAGSEEMIRLQFEEYILSLCSAMAYQVYRERTDGSVKDVLWKDETPGQETGIVSTANATDAPELQEKHASDNNNEETPPEKPPRSGSQPQIQDPSVATQHQHHQHHLPHPHIPGPHPHIPGPHPHLPGRAHQRTSSLDAHLPPADLGNNALDFNPEFLSSWRDTRNFDLFLASLPASITAPFSPTDPSSIIDTTSQKRPRIFDLIPPAHPTGGGLNIDDVQRRLQQSFEDWRTTYKVDERLGQTKENVGKAIEAGRERFGKLWADLEERRRKGGQGQGEGGAGGGVSKENSRPGSIDGRSATTAYAEGGATAAAGNDCGNTASSAGGAAWTTTLRERAAKVQKPDTTQLQHAAKENAAKAGAYLSSWGSWAKEKSRDWQGGANVKKGGAELQQGPGMGSGRQPAATAVVPMGQSTAAAETATMDADAVAGKPQRQSVGKFKEDIE